MTQRTFHCTVMPTTCSLQYGPNVAKIRQQLDDVGQHLPKFTDLGPDLAELGEISPSSGQGCENSVGPMLSNAGRIWQNSGQHWPKSGASSANLFDVGSTLNEFGTCLADFHPSLACHSVWDARYGRPNPSKFGRTRTKVGRNWPTPARNRSKFGRLRAALAELDQVCPKFGHIWSEFDRFRP